MPLQSNALLSSSTTHPKKGILKPDKRLRKAQSHASFVAPLLRLVRDPAGSIEEALESFWVGANKNVLSETTTSDFQGRKLLLEHRMKDAEDYSTWHETALELDRLEGNDAWKSNPASPFYDYNLLQARLNQLEDARISGDPRRILFLLRTSLTRSLGNMGDLHLYKYSHVGTKSLIEDYISTACNTLDALLKSIATAKESEYDCRNALDQLLATRQSFGRSALLLSGGATFGMTHIGVVKTLWERDLLPRIVCGASAGSIISAVLCAKTDAEIPDTIRELCYADFDVFEKTGAKETVLQKAARFAKYGALFDIQHLTKVLKDLLGDLTFQEAYNRTRRILNISVSTASLHELPRLLNYITAPNVIIWSAVAASCSVPLVFSPATILAKDPRDGSEVRWNPSEQLWIDGSVDNDLPMTRLAEMFNVNHFLVSQVNPHVVPFLIGEETMAESATKEASSDMTGPTVGWFSTLAGLAKSEALHRMHVLTELGVLPNYLTKLRSVLSQKYSGDITILPEISYSQLPKILTNPTPEFMMKAVLCGQRATWPKLSRIQNHCAIELALDSAVQKLRAHIAFSPSQVDLRLLSLEPSTHNGLSLRSKTIQQRGTKTKSWCVDPRSDKPSFSSHYRLEEQLPDTDSSVTVTGGESEGEEQDDDYLSLRRPKRRRTRPQEPAYDSSGSNPRSYSPSDLESPDPPAAPELWPSRSLFPFKSQPTTPLASSRRMSAWSFTPADAALPSLTMSTSMVAEQPAAAQGVMSEAERRYKRHFHRTSIPSASPEADISGTRGMLLRKKSTGL
ncbi:patatin-domain-containing protein [Microthyrium microscopicum]|uniref:Patatin-like phospholipase domain-containing protein n=1 Tax=Microthyrium microscopicum TaxID=703497 RepID=A0A6A6U1U6_9PEZI|nr:patatin-domain-containing protein [Microthyrium microscopicum]